MARLDGKRGEGKLAMIVVGVLLLVLVGGYWMVGAVADYMAAKVPDRWEADMFGSLGARQDKWREAAETEGQKKALAVFEKLKAQPGLRDLDYKLYFVPDKTPNAFALPGGSIAVTDGLLELVQGEVGLAAVLGHEFGHQQFRHSLKMMGRSLLFAGIMMFVLGGDNGMIVSLMLDMAERSHSRGQELEADEYGLTMVHGAMGTTKGALEFFTKLEADPDTKDVKLLNMLSSHPYTPDRIKRMRKIAKDLESGAAG